jgi:hypothetical protein
MIELYVVVTLFALGYMINQSDTSKKTKQSQTINKSEIPSVNNIYDSRFCDVANSFAQKRSHSMVEASKNPARTGVISRNYKLNEEIQKKDQPLMKKRMKLMSGEEVDEMEFTHNNMIPFFKTKYGL